MSVTTKKLAAQQLRPPEWPKEIDGLDELEKVAAEAHSRLLLTCQRRREAEAEVVAMAARRDDLVRRAKAGEVVSGQEIAEVEAAIRAAESSVAILGEAIPGIEAEVEAADEAIRSKIRQVQQVMREQARAYHAAAQQATQAAKRVEEEAAELLRQLGGGHVFYFSGEKWERSRTDAALQRYAPEAYTRQIEWRARKQQAASAAPGAGRRGSAFQGAFPHHGADEPRIESLPSH